MRAVIYARYSSDQQREASIEDQIRVCERRIEREGWTLLHNYHDRALSGASRLRPGYQKLLEDARAQARSTSWFQRPLIVYRAIRRTSPLSTNTSRLPG